MNTRHSVISCFVYFLLGLSPLVAQAAGESLWRQSGPPGEDRRGPVPGALSAEAEAAWLAEQTPGEAVPWSAASAMRSAVGMAEVGGELWGNGPDYKVRFGAGGIVFVPALGESAPHVMPLGFAVEAVFRGSVLVYQASPSGSAPEQAGVRVHYRHSPVLTESYELRAEGVEQSFRFDSLPPGSGDLVVRGRIDTELPFSNSEACESAEGLRFEIAGLGGVSIGAVTGVDAAGTKARGKLRFDGAYLELSLPGEFVDRAAFPLVLDPLVGAIISVAVGANDDHRPDVAYDFSYNRYLVVWDRKFAADDIDIRGHRLSGIGALVGGLIVIEGELVPIARNPAVANVNVSDRFLVVWQEQPAAGDDWDIAGKAVNASDGAVSAALTIASTASEEIDPDAGGELYSATYTEAFVVWDGESVSFGIKGREVTVPVGAGAPSFPAGEGVVTITTGDNSSSPAISKSGGVPGRWLVVWEQDFSLPAPGIDYLWGRIVNYNSDLCTTVTVIADDVGDEILSPDCGGDGTQYLIVWERQEDWDLVSDIRCAHASYAGACGAGGELEVDPEALLYADGGLDVHSPAVDWCGDEYLVAYSKQSQLYNLLSNNIWVMGVDPDGCFACEPRVLVDASLTNDNLPSVVAQLSSSSTAGHDVLVVWESSATAIPFAGDIKAQRYRCAPGNVNAIAPPCGTGGGSAGVTCAGIGAPSFAHLVDGAHPLAPAFLAVGFSQLNFTCGNCVFVPNLNLFFSVLTDANGSAAIVTPIPDDPSLAGVKIYDQWAVLATPPGCALFGLSLSGALEIELGL